MCGIALILRTDPAGCPGLRLKDMTASVRHRGPDGEGLLWLRRNGAGGMEPADSDADWVIGLGHRRLSIIDLSPAAAQPMARNGVGWIIFNGEIYNYLELRQELIDLGETFQSRSDTEVILAAYQRWGLSCFSRFRGMWAIVIADERRDQLVLSRDRLGIKPLYTRRGPGWFMAASEIKEFAAAGGGRLSPDPAALRLYLDTGWEDPGRTLFEGVTPVDAGTWAIVDLRTGDEKQRESYWHPEQTREAVGDVGVASRALEEVLEGSVRIHLRSDVPVGVALSGGIDSALMAMLATRIRGSGGESLHSFSAVFPGDANDEGAAAERVAARLGSKWHSVSPAGAELRTAFDRFLWHHDEPVGSASQFAAYRVAALTRETGVPVSLNGQGGDELLCGYWQSYFVSTVRFLREGRVGPVADALLGSLLPGGNSELWRQVPKMAARYARRRRAPDAILGVSGGGGATRMGRLEQMRRMFLPRLLKWDDRNFMAFGVESRYPYLDPLVIDTCLSFKTETLCRRGWTKEPARRVLERGLGQDFARTRRKLGFETPQDRWLAGPLRELVDELGGSASALGRIVGPHRIRDVVDTFRGTPDAVAGKGEEVFRFLSADRWLRVFGLAL